jgi:hypothetical protein
MASVNHRHCLLDRAAEDVASHADLEQFPHLIGIGKLDSEKIGAIT